MTEQEKEFLRIAKLLHDNNCLKDVVVIGSWAEFIYKNSGLLSNFNPELRTNDCDFLCKNLRRSNPKINLVKILEDDGYFIEPDIMHEACKIRAKSGFEIEFLLSKKGAGKEVTLKSNFGFYVITLWHVSVLLNNTITVNCFGMDVDVPKPEAYVLQKIVINASRDNKKEKDDRSIKGLWNYLEKAEFERIFKILTSREQKAVSRYLESNNLLLN